MRLGDPVIWTLKYKAIAVVLGIGLVSGVLWAWSAAAERRARELAIAEEHEKQAAALKQANDAHDKQLAIEREATAKLIEANSALAQRIQQVSAARDAEAARNRAAALAPKTVEQAVQEAIANLHITPRAEADNRVSITKEELQQFSAMKIDLDRLVAKDAERDQQLRLATDTIARLQTTITSLEASAKEKDAVIAAQERTITDYKKVATRSKWRKFGSAAGRIGLAVLPAVAAAVVLR